MTQLSPKEYICDACGAVCEKGWGDDEAMLESEALFGELRPENAATVCDDCFNELFPRAYEAVN